MNLKQTIEQDIIKAMKAGEKEKLAVLRYLKAQVNDKEFELQVKELTDKDLIALINGQLKKLEESLVIFEKVKREDLVSKNKKEIEVLKNYLPAQISDEELSREVEEVIKANPNLPHPGALIGIAIKKLAGKADNQRISKMVMSKIKK